MKTRCSLAILVVLLSVFASCAQQSGLQDDLCLKYLVRKPATVNASTPILILLHGYGSNEADLFELGKAIPSNWLVVAARGPLDVDNGGYQWYHMTRDNGHHSGKKEDMDRSRDLVVKFISQLLKKYKTDPHQVYVSGFSQGGMMSYLIGLSHPESVAGIAPLSGMIVDVLKPELQLEKAKSSLRLFVGHGDADDRIPFADDQASVEYLQHSGLIPELHVYKGMTHQISREELSDLVRWLGKK